jgi:hypothetical protein
MVREKGKGMVRLMVKEHGGGREDEVGDGRV